MAAQSRDYCISALFHQPLGCAGGAADADGVHALKPFFLDFLRSLNEVTVWIYTLTFVEEHLAVAALASAHEKHQVVARGE